jgi:hypothetical protein
MTYAAKLGPVRLTADDYQRLVECLKDTVSVLSRDVSIEYKLEHVEAYARHALALLGEDETEEEKCD